MSETPVPPEVEIGESAIKRLNREGWRESFRPLQIVDEAREALVIMPEGKSGVVLGSGPNTEQWKTKGWVTLDINPEYQADFTQDANLMETVIQPNSQDYLYAEAIRMDPLGREGVGRARLLEQANKALRTGGTLIIKSAHFENRPQAKVPERREYAKKLRAHGFEAVIELHDILNPEGRLEHQQVIYYGKKVAEGYDSSRAG